MGENLNADAIPITRQKKNGNYSTFSKDSVFSVFSVAKGFLIYLMPGIFPAMPFIILLIPPLLNIFIIFCICSN